jgi:hypothetical protein
LVVQSTEILERGPTMADRTVTLHRVLKAPPERVYRAFLDPQAMCKWLPPKGFVAQVQEMDAREGGRYRMSFRNFGNGRRTPSAAATCAWCPTRPSATATTSTTRTCPAR